MSDAWLLGRARELNAIVQRSDRTEQLKIIGTVDELLEETQRRGEPILIAQLLRAASLARLVTRGIALEAEPLLDELLAHTRRHGLALLRADAHAIRGRLLVLSVQEDAALTEIARAHQAVRDSAGPHEITLQLINRVKMLLGWGLRLERVGRDDEASEKFRTAASMAIAVEAPFAESLFPRQAGVPAVDQVGVLAASLALAAPSSAHLDRLRKLNSEQGWPHEHVIVTIALARCLEGVGGRDEAMRMLIEAQHLQADDNSQPSMRLNLFREIARLGSEGAVDGAAGPDGAIRPDDNRPAALLADYSAALEAELWALRESQIATLNTRREHERLSAEHGAITQQALQDPLTGLPNRRALDDRLRTLAGSVNAQPLAVALVDLDGFKDVNDRHSHAEGDDVLRVVASTLRDALRGDDLVARYGGDEFIALLPGAPVSAAKQALGRAVTAVASLPHHLSHGVTLSVGLVSLRPQERAEQVLSRADAAMYQAKRRGGNQIAAATAGVGDPLGGWPEDVTPTDPTWDLEEHT